MRRGVEAAAERPPRLVAFPNDKTTVDRDYVTLLRYWRQPDGDPIGSHAKQKLTSSRRRGNTGQCSDAFRIVIERCG